ncbi:MAG: chemotaxis protein CheW, partial [Planctomycetes bacterium]|nr:chemotaxis protein CheW [Planctomycetota bacterium]
GGHIGALQEYLTPGGAPPAVANAAAEAGPPAPPVPAVDDGPTGGPESPPPAVEPTEQAQRADPVAAVETPTPKREPSGEHKATESSIRVSVGLLNKLMNLSGEMVLGRNQVLQSIRPSSDRGLQQAVANLSQVVSEIQEAVMQTRLQPVANVFQKFPRIVRDLAAKLGKQCRLDLGGKEVELDRSILEALGDPLTHLVRNALDHGIESPEVRRAKDKPPEGLLTLQAFHQGGNVKIKIIDDGAGIDPQRMRRKAIEKAIVTPEQANAMSDRDAIMLIFAPGFSTAEQVSDVSGRGVGMDVVRSNIEKIGGHVEVQSERGRGTTLTITIPLTLAIVPALIVSCCERRYVIPQNNVTELVRVRAEDARQRIVRVRGREVVRLRGQLLPIVRLRDALGVGTGAEQEGAAHNIVVVQSGAVHYGLVIDSPPDTEEIVVKPLGSHLRSRGEYSGSTILGDGRVALILDVVGLGNATGLRAEEAVDDAPRSTVANGAHEEPTDFVIFRAHPEELFAVPLGLVSRIKRVPQSDIADIGGELVHRVEDGVMPVVRLADHVTARQLPDTAGFVSLLVLRVHEVEFALVTSAIEDIRTLSVAVDDRTLATPGVVGSFELGGHTVRLVDVSEIARRAIPQLLVGRDVAAVPPERDPNREVRVLLAEDSGFFRNHVARVIKSGGFAVVACEDGEAAWQKLQEVVDEIDLVVTDVQMPRCDGLELTRRIRADRRTSRLPVVMLSSLSNEEDVAAGHAAGANDYLIKMDDASLIAALTKAAGVVS